MNRLRLMLALGLAVTLPACGDDGDGAEAEDSSVSQAACEEALTDARLARDALAEEEALEPVFEHLQDLSQSLQEVGRSQADVADEASDARGVVDDLIAVMEGVDLSAPDAVDQINRSDAFVAYRQPSFRDTLRRVVEGSCGAELSRDESDGEGEPAQGRN